METTSIFPFFLQITVGKFRNLNECFPNGVLWTPRGRPQQIQRKMGRWHLGFCPLSCPPPSFNKKKNTCFSYFIHINLNKAIFGTKIMEVKLGRSLLNEICFLWSSKVEQSSIYGSVAATQDIVRTSLESSFRQDDPNFLVSSLIENIRLLKLTDLQSSQFIQTNSWCSR